MKHLPPKCRWRGITTAQNSCPPRAIEAHQVGASVASGSQRLATRVGRASSATGRSVRAFPSGQPAWGTRNIERGYGALPRSSRNPGGRRHRHGWSEGWLPSGGKNSAEFKGSKNPLLCRRTRTGEIRQSASDRAIVVRVNCRHRARRASDTTLRSPSRTARRSQPRCQRARRRSRCP